MKPRDFLNFFKTKSGKLAAFAVLFAAALIIFSALRKHHQSPDDAVSVTALATNATDKPQVVQSVVRPMRGFLSAATQTGTDEFSVIVTWLLQTIAIAKRSRESSANPRAHQFICRQFGRHSAGKEVERGVCPVRTADFL